MKGYFLAALTLGLLFAAAVAASVCSFPSKITHPQKPVDFGHAFMVANEQAAVSVLKKIPDAIGQYELFAEPEQPVSFDALRLFDASMLPRSLQPTGRQGVERSEGYLFQIHADAQLEAWCVLAWPEQCGTTGVQSFVVASFTQDVLQTSQSYSGFDQTPSPECAFENGVKGGPSKAGWKKAE